MQRICGHHYGWEQALEIYYDFQIWKSVRGAVDYQFINNPAYFYRRLLDHISQGWSVAGLLELAQATKDVFDHHDRAIHDDAEVHRAERQQVCRNAAPSQADKRRQQRERYNEGNYGRRSKIA